jgi:hypothetical protein
VRAGDLKHFGDHVISDFRVHDDQFEDLEGVDWLFSRIALKPPRSETMHRLVQRRGVRIVSPARLPVQPALQRCEGLEHRVECKNRAHGAPYARFQTKRRSRMTSSVIKIQFLSENF